jgi:hypothetical protein
MTLEQDLVATERKLWTNDAAVYEENLIPEALLVFAETGVITRDVALDAIRKENAKGRRWAEVKFQDVCTLKLGNDAALLTYKATARWERRHGEHDRALHQRLHAAQQCLEARASSANRARRSR